MAFIVHINSATSHSVELFSKIPFSLIFQGFLEILFLGMMERLRNNVSREYRKGIQKKQTKETGKQKICCLTLTNSNQLHGIEYHQYFLAIKSSPISSLPHTPSLLFYFSVSPFLCIYDHRSSEKSRMTPGNT